MGKDAYNCNAQDGGSFLPTGQSATDLVEAANQQCAEDPETAAKKLKIERHNEETVSMSRNAVSAGL
jgi:hypothetical protein